jgi:hypothetical protein
MDKRFWSGAVVVVTVVVAGASALPRLLLQPAVDETAEIAPPAPFVSRPVALTAAQQPQAAPQLVRQPEAEPGNATPVAPATVAARVADPVPQASAPVAKPPSPAPQTASPPPLPSPPVVQVAGASPFPPVQPVGVADQPKAPPVADAAPTQIRDARATPQASERGSERRREKVTRAAVQAEASRRRRHVRPATYPIREFLAWRR